MALSGEEYVTAHRKKIERRQKMLTIVSIMSFFGSTAFAGVSAIKQAIHDPKPATISAESSLQQQAQGFEFVLQREPENQVALEGLAMTRIRLKNVQGAIQPLEKLVKLHPDRKDYKFVLEQVKKQVEKGNH
jgi:cytochrome c-type biogenesis protein CcmH/NrfG